MTPHDPELEELITSYLLGDLSATDAKRVEEYLRQRSDARALADELKQTLNLLDQALSGPIAAPRRLDPDHRAAILPDTSRPSEPKLWFQGHARLLAQVAAMLVITAGLYLLLRQGARTSPGHFSGTTATMHSDPGERTLQDIQQVEAMTEAERLTFPAPRRMAAVESGQEPLESVGHGFGPSVARASAATMTAALAYPQRAHMWPVRLDCDMLSYVRATKELDAGLLPAVDSISAAAFCQAFGREPWLAETGGPRALDASSPPSEQIRLSVEVAPIPHSDEMLLRVSLQAVPAETESQPLSVIVLADVGRSMQPNQGIVRETLAALADVLHPNDRVALMTFGGDAGPREILPLSSALHRDALRQAAREMFAPRLGTETTAASDSSPMAGLKKACAIFNHAPSAPENARRLVLVLSDLIGTTEADQVTALSRRVSDQWLGEGIRSAWLGFGAENQPAQMEEQLAGQGGGFYASIQNREAAINCFAQRLHRAGRPAAESLQVWVAFDPEVVLTVEPVSDLPQVPPRSGFAFHDADQYTLFEGDSRTVMYRLRLRNLESPATLGSLHLSYQVPGTDVDETIEHVEDMGVICQKQDLAQSSMAHRRATAALIFAELLTGCAEASDLAVLEDLTDAAPLFRWARLVK